LTDVYIIKDPDGNVVGYLKERVFTKLWGVRITKSFRSDKGYTMEEWE